jgi:hypothetical protein
VYEVAPFAAVAFKVMVAPAQYGPRFDAVTPQMGAQDRLPPPADSEIPTTPLQPPALVKSKM